MVVVVGGSGGRCFLQFCNWEGTASDIIDASRYFAGCQIHEDDKRVGKLIRRFEQQLKDVDAIGFICKVTKRTSEYWFKSENPFLMSPMSPLSSTSPLSPMSPRSEEDIKDNVGDMK